MKAPPKIPGLYLALGLAGASLLAADTLASAPAPAIVRPSLPAITLHIGDPAPALTVAKWLKGTPVRSFVKGKVYVIECWATWCGPCRESMPHLSELAKKYEGKATFAGVAVWQLAQTKKKDTDYLPIVESFVDHAHEMMAYNVAIDTSGGDDGVIAKTWLMAANRNGVPCSFVVDKEGRIAWIGHPMMGLDEAIGLAIEDKLDATAVAKIDGDNKARSEKAAGIYKRLNGLVKAGDNAATIAAADELSKTSPLYEFAAMPAKYEALYATDPKAAAAYAHEIIAAYANAPPVLYVLAQKIVTGDAKRSDYGTAIALSEAALKCSDPSDPWIMGTYARALFKSGDAARAVSLQESVIESIKNGIIDPKPDVVDQANKALRQYQAGLMAEKT